MRKIDRRYAQDRGRIDPNAPAPKPYRAGLFQNAKSQKRDGEGFREIAAKTGLSVNTVRDAFAGQCVKIDTLKTLADYYAIPWAALFDLDGIFTIGVATKTERIGLREFDVYAGLYIKSVDLDKIGGPDPATPEKASGYKAGGK